MKNLAVAQVKLALSNIQLRSCQAPHVPWLVFEMLQTCSGWSFVAALDNHANRQCIGATASAACRAVHTTLPTRALFLKEVP